MKYGLIYYKNTDNIGDDIQNYAVMQFLPHIDYLIDREALSDFSKDVKEDVAVIMNGWFLHNKFNWPPSKNIYPLCTSMHFTPNDYIDIGYKFLDDIGGDYLKNYEPIGCRDLSTKKMLESKGIQSYLSGCVTLTLNKRKKHEKKEKYICIVDVPCEVENMIKQKINGSDIILRKITHWVNYKEQPIAWEERIAKVEELLDIYQEAFCVVTKRLHCALPCLALGVPVLLILDNEKDDVTRYSHFTELLHTTSTKAFADGNSVYNVLYPPDNKDIYIEEKLKLESRIRDFINNIQNGILKKSFYEWQKRNENEILMWRLKILSHSAEFSAEKIDLLLKELNTVKLEVYNERKKFAEQYQNDTNTLKNEILVNGAEIDRLNSVIKEKNKEEDRLNHIIKEKNKEEDRLNHIIKEKNKEEERLNAVIIERNKSIEQNKQEKEQLENKSVVWLLFFSDRFKNSSLKQKLNILFSVIKIRNKN